MQDLQPTYKTLLWNFVEITWNNSLPKIEGLFYTVAFTCDVTGYKNQFVNVTCMKDCMRSYYVNNTNAVNCSFIVSATNLAGTGKDYMLPITVPMLGKKINYIIVVFLLFICWAENLR